MWQSFVCAMIAAVTLQAYNPFRTGKLVLYQVRYHTTWREFEILPFVFLGVLGGLYGSVLIRLNMLYARLRERWRIARYPVVEVIAVTLLTSLIAFPSRLLRTQSSELLYNLFADCADLADDNLGLCSAQTRSIALILLLLAASLVGCLLTSVTFGLHLPAGVILPAMVIGALYGRVVGLVMQAWQQAFPALLLFRSCATDGACVTPGTYAIIGAASCLGGTTRMTISTVVIMFELTGALTYVLPIMVAVMISKWVGDACTGRGIFESWIDHLALPFLDSRDGSTAVPDLSVDHVMTLAANMAVLTASGHSVQSVIDLLNANRYAGYPVLASPTDAALLGYISRDALIGALEETSLAHPQSHLGSQVYFQRPSYPSAAPVVDLTAYVDTAPVALSPAVSLRFAMNLVQQLGLQKVLLTEKGLLKGIITRKDVWYALKMANS